MCGSTRNHASEAAGCKVLWGVELNRSGLRLGGVGERRHFEVWTVELAGGNVFNSLPAYYTYT